MSAESTPSPSGVNSKPLPWVRGVTSLADGIRVPDGTCVARPLRVGLIRVGLIRLGMDQGAAGVGFVPVFADGAESQGCPLRVNPVGVGTHFPF